VDDCKSNLSERKAHAEARYERLLGPRDASATDDDSEFMEILRRFIFGDVFDTGVLDEYGHWLERHADKRCGRVASAAALPFSSWTVGSPACTVYNVNLRSRIVM